MRNQPRALILKGTLGGEVYKACSAIDQRHSEKVINCKRSVLTIEEQLSSDICWVRYVT